MLTQNSHGNLPMVLKGYSFISSEFSIILLQQFKVFLLKCLIGFVCITDLTALFLNKLFGVLHNVKVPTKLPC